MAQVLVTESYLDDIADAIRDKNGSEDTYTPAQMADAIENIHTADEVVLVSKSVTANGTYNPASDSADGYSGVTVNVPNTYTESDEGKVVSSGALVAQTSRNVTVNGTYDTTENNEVVVNVPTGGGSPILIPKTITANGTYDPSDDSADGFSSVVVNVSGDDSFTLTDYIESSGTQWIDTGYVPTENSKFEGVVLFETGQSQFAMFFGGRDTSSGLAGNPVLFGCGTESADSFITGWGFNLTYSGNMKTSPYLNRKIKFIVDKNGVDVKSTENHRSNGEVYTGTTPLTTKSIYLFSLNANGADFGSGTHCKMKLYRFRIYEGDTLLHEFIPWVDSNDIACLKDTITGNIKYNAGTGSFTYGTDE